MSKYESMKVSELRDIAKFKSLKGWSKLKKSQLITFIMDNESRRPLKSKYKPKTKYFSFFSSMTVEELHDFARENKIQGYSSLKKAKLIRFLDKTCSIIWFTWRRRGVRKNLERRMFPDALRVWVGLFVSDKSIVEHYAQIILHTLSPINCFGKKKSKRVIAWEEYAKREGLQMRNLDLGVSSDSEDEDLPDGW